MQELVVADQKQSRVSCGLSISVVNAAAMRPTAAILKERGTMIGCRPRGHEYKSVVCLGPNASVELLQAFEA